MAVLFESDSHLIVLFRKAICKERGRSTKRRAAYDRSARIKSPKQMLSLHCANLMTCDGATWEVWIALQSHRLILGNPNLSQVALYLLYTNVFSFLGCTMLLDDNHIDSNVNYLGSCWRTLPKPGLWVFPFQVFSFLL